MSEMRSSTMLPNSGLPPKRARFKSFLKVFSRSTGQGISPNDQSVENDAPTHHGQPLPVPSYPPDVLFTTATPSDPDSMLPTSSQPRTELEEDHTTSGEPESLDYWSDISAWYVVLQSFIQGIITSFASQENLA